MDYVLFSLEMNLEVMQSSRCFEFTKISREIRSQFNVWMARIVDITVEDIDLVLWFVIYIFIGNAI